MSDLSIFPVDIAEMSVSQLAALPPAQKHEIDKNLDAAIDWQGNLSARLVAVPRTHRRLAAAGVGEGASLRIVAAALAQHYRQQRAALTCCPKCRVECRCARSRTLARRPPK